MSPAVSQVQRSKRVAELDGLRAFAIIPVLLLHWSPTEGRFWWIGIFGKAGWIGVDLFFVLSGYLITGILLGTVQRPHYYRNFVTRRTLRIFPLYYLCLILFTLATRVAGGEPWASLHEWGGVGWFFAYVGNLRTAWMNTWPSVFLFVPLWSLQIEEQFYLLYPLVIARLSRRGIGILLICCVVAAPLLRSCLLLIWRDHALACYVLTPCRMDSLALGGLVALMFRSPDRQPSYARVRSVAMCSGAIATVMYVVCRLLGSATEYDLPMASIGYTVIDIAFASLLALIIVRPSGALINLLRWRPLVYTGQIAYGLYLLHEPTSLSVRKVVSVIWRIDLATVPALALPIYFAATFIVASLSWRFFESPILSLKARVTT
jgi:peptidoglycan/LPS O-acetylase OafA/YrhL